MKGVPQFNDHWFEQADLQDVEEIYKGKPEHKAAVDHWRKLHPTKGKKKPVEKDDEKEQED